MTAKIKRSSASRFEEEKIIILNQLDNKTERKKKRPRGIFRGRANGALPPPLTPNFGNVGEKMGKWEKGVGAIGKNDIKKPLLYPSIIPNNILA